MRQRRLMREQDLFIVGGMGAWAGFLLGLILFVLGLGFSLLTHIALFVSMGFVSGILVGILVVRS